MVLCRDYQNIICVSNIWGAFKCKSFQQASRHPTITYNCDVKPVMCSTSASSLAFVTKIRSGPKCGLSPTNWTEHEDMLHDARNPAAAFEDFHACRRNVTKMHVDESARSVMRHVACARNVRSI